MKTDKRRKLEAAGWRVGDAHELLELTPDESAFVEINSLSPDASGSFERSTTGHKPSSPGESVRASRESRRWKRPIQP